MVNQLMPEFFITESHCRSPDSTFVFAEYKTLYHISGQNTIALCMITPHSWSISPSATASPDSHKTARRNLLSPSRLAEQSPLLPRYRASVMASRTGLATSSPVCAVCGTRQNWAKHSPSPFLRVALRSQPYSRVPYPSSMMTAASR